MRPEGADLHHVAGALGRVAARGRLAIRRGPMVARGVIEVHVVAVPRAPLTADDHHRRLQQQRRRVALARRRRRARHVSGHTPYAPVDVVLADVGEVAGGAGAAKDEQPGRLARAPVQRDHRRRVLCSRWRGGGAGRKRHALPQRRVGGGGAEYERVELAELGLLGVLAPEQERGARRRREAQARAAARRRRVARDVVPLAPPHRLHVEHEELVGGALGAGGKCATEPPHERAQRPRFLERRRLQRVARQRARRRRVGRVGLGEDNILLGRSKPGAQRAQREQCAHPAWSHARRTRGRRHRWPGAGAHEGRAARALDAVFSFLHVATGI